MAQMRKVEGQLEIKSQAAKFFNVWTKEAHRLPELCPNRFRKLELKKGCAWDSLGAIKVWHFVMNGHHDIAKTELTEIDLCRRTVSDDWFGGGSIEKFYKSFNTKMEVVPHCNGSIVKWNFEYEKKCEHSSPDADMFMDFILGAAKDLDASLCNIDARCGCNA